MLENKHNLTVDTQSKSIGNAFVEVVQNDNVALEVQIYNNNLLVDNTAYTYTLLSVLPSKERIIRQGSIGPNGYPVFYLGVEEMSETGIILAMVQVYDELGNRVTSYDFKYRMKEDLSTGGVVPSADNPKFVIITEDSLSQTVQDAQQSKVELDAMKTDVEGVTHLTPNDRLVSDYNKINSELGKKAVATSVYTKKETDNLLDGIDSDVNTVKDRSFLINLLGNYGGFYESVNGVGVGWVPVISLSTIARIESNKQYITTTLENDLSGINRLQIMNFKKDGYFLYMTDVETDGVSTASFLVRATGGNYTKEHKSKERATLYLKNYNLNVIDSRIQLFNLNDNGVAGWVAFSNVRIYEIDEETYNKIDVDPEFTGDKLVEKFPYRDDLIINSTSLEMQINILKSELKNLKESLSGTP